MLWSYILNRNVWDNTQEGIWVLSTYVRSASSAILKRIWANRGRYCHFWKLWEQTAHWSRQPSRRIRKCKWKRKTGEWEVLWPWKDAGCIGYLLSGSEWMMGIQSIFFFGKLTHVVTHNTDSQSISTSSLFVAWGSVLWINPSIVFDSCLGPIMLEFKTILHLRTSWSISCLSTVQASTPIFRISSNVSIFKRVSSWTRVTFWLLGKVATVRWGRSDCSVLEISNKGHEGDDREATETATT